MGTYGPRLRDHARAIAEAAIAAADPAAAVRTVLHGSPADLVVDAGGGRLRLGGRVLLVAAGKAARRMTEGALAGMSPRLPEKCLVVTTHQAADPLAGCVVLGAGHPSPDPAGLRATAAVADVAASAGPGDTLLVLLSGGSSALLPSPVEGVSLADLADTSDLLMSAGADIRQLNCVRKHLSVLQGGGLARLAGRATVCCLVLSDVAGDDPSVVGSGPTVGDPTTHHDAVEVLRRLGVWDRSPASVRRHLQAGVRGERADTPGPGDPVFERTHTWVVSGNGSALHGAAAEARRLGYRPEVVEGSLTGEARAVAPRLMRDLRAAARSPVPACLLYGGETTVTVRGDGSGGRCQELALAAALAATDLAAARWVLACVGTDGRDGPTDAAGGMVDGGTVARIVAAGGDPRALLADNDSNRALALAGDLVVTGPTGTNVADVVIGLLDPDSRSRGPSHGRLISVSPVAGTDRPPWEAVVPRAPDRRFGLGDASADVFAVLEDLERRSDALPSGSRRLHLSGDRAWADDADVAAIPIDRREAGQVDAPSDAPTAILPTAAALVRLSKFSADGRVRVRAFYPSAGVTAKVVVGSRSRQAPVQRDAAARSDSRRWVHLDVPSLVAWGRSRGYAYLVEELVTGRHPSARDERQRVAEALVGAVVDRRPTGPPLRLHVHWRTRARLAGLGATEAGVEIPVDRLVALAGGMGRASMPGGWCHGDLVPSNVVAGGGRLRVIDFEHAGRMPVACDLAKIVAKAPEWRSLLDDLVARDPLADGGPDTRTQLRWVYLRELSWARARERRAIAVGRLENHRSWMNRCLELIDALR